MKPSLFAVLLLCAPLASPEALPPPSDTPQQDDTSSSITQTFQGKCLWMMTTYDCIVVSRHNQIFWIYRDKKGTAYKWKILPDGTRVLEWARDDLST
ncbi:MAG: hypothetical protein WAV50_01350 [Minisyncoccia bacterium]